MKKQVLLIFAALLLFSYASSAQIYEGDSKNHLKNLFRAGKYDKSSIKTETDSSYTYLLRGDIKPVDIYFLFDKKSNCYFEKWTFDCDTCYNETLKKILDKGRYKWKKSDNNTYLSKSSKQLKLSVDLPKLTFTITQLYMREEDYLLLYNKTAAIQN